MSRLMTVLLLVWSLGAWAADGFRVESAPQQDRATAASLVSALGDDPSMTELDDLHIGVVRRFIRGTGWRYVVQIKDVESLDQARALAQGLASSAGQARVIDTDGGLVIPVGEGTTTPPPIPAPTPTAKAEPSSRAPDASAVLRAAVRAHGGRQGGRAVLAEATSFAFTFERSVAVDSGTIVARHRVLRAGDLQRLDVAIVEGEGQDSETFIDKAGQATVVVDGVRTPRDPARTREIVDRFHPEQVLAIPLGLPADVTGAAEWRGLQVVESEDPEDKNLIILRPAEAAGSGDHMVEVDFDDQSMTLRRMEWATDHGHITFFFADYREVAPHLVVPFELRIEKDGRAIEQLRIIELTINPDLDPALFVSPAK